MARLRRLPGWDDAVQAVRNDPQLNRYVAGAPDNTVAFLTEVRKYMRQQGENATEGLTVQGRNMQRAAGWHSDAEAVDAAARRSSPIAYDMAQSMEADLRNRYLDPMLRGPLGALVKKEDTSTARAIDAFFPKDPRKHYSAEEVGDAITNMLGDPAHPSRPARERAVNDLIRAHVESVFDSAARNLQSGPPRAGGANFYKQLMGSEQQRRNLQAAIEATPGGAQKWEGFRRFLDITEASAPPAIGSKTAYNVEFNRDLAGGGAKEVMAHAAGSPTQFGQRMAEKIDRWRLGRNLDELGRIFTDQRSADFLRRIATSPRGGDRELNLTRALISYTDQLRSDRYQPVQQRN
jgi:hypothetical protein